MTENRLIELEMRTTFQDDTITALNDALVSQQHQIDQLRQEIAGLRDRVLALQLPEPGPPTQEIPPHY